VSPSSERPRVRVRVRLRVEARVKFLELQEKIVTMTERVAMIVIISKNYGRVIEV
jgi:hypothetical protein